ncbi:MAG: hypothetical protein H0V17_15655 [Deltaproteobacteria bacterium]|nr:hypothetical protein [Deltaproteobacteria bacterium]
MRIALTLYALATSIAIAAPAPRPKPIARPAAPTTWADWVGAYHGTVTWSRCSVAGANTAPVAFEIVDGVASIDLTLTRPGMPSLSLVSDDKGWSGRRGDVAVTLTRPKPDTLDLAVDLDSGCMVRGRMSRATTGVAACNSLVAWARIESRCTKLTTPPLEDLPKLAAVPWKPADAARCQARAATLERSLIDTGCAPHPDPQIGVRARACLALGEIAAKLSRCPNALPQIKDAAVATANALVAASQSAETATLPYVEQQCRDTHAELVSIATQFRCPL